MSVLRSLLFAAMVLALPTGCASATAAPTPEQLSTVITCNKHPVRGKWRCDWTTDYDYAVAPGAVTPAS